MILFLKILGLIFIAGVIISETDSNFHMSNSTAVLMLLWVYWVSGFFI